MRVRRLLDAPIISPRLHPSLGTNIQGPSLVRAPGWVKNPMGRLYLYFADHKGTFIRLAFADDVIGPWRVHPPGSLHLDDSYFLTEPPPATDAELEQFRSMWEAALGPDHMPRDLVVDATVPHIASPDVHVEEESQTVVMYFHGLDALGVQVTRLATSTDGIRFRAQPEILGASYMRVFSYDGWRYALTMPGHLSRSVDGRTGFEPGPTLFDLDMRHAALLRWGDDLHVFWTRVGDSPERILRSTIDLRGDWLGWHESETVEMLRAQRPWEGADTPVEPSRRGAVYEHVNQLRDPAIFEDDDRTYLLYAVAGESGIAIAEIED